MRCSNVLASWQGSELGKHVLLSHGVASAARMVLASTFQWPLRRPVIPEPHWLQGSKDAICGMVHPKIFESKCCRPQHWVHPNMKDNKQAIWHWCLLLANNCCARFIFPTMINCCQNTIHLKDTTLHNLTVFNGKSMNFQQSRWIKVSFRWCVAQRLCPDSAPLAGTIAAWLCQASSELGRRACAKPEGGTPMLRV